MEENANLDTCPKCGEFRWKTPDDGAHDQWGDADGGANTTNKKRVPRKILRYFPLTPRLRRLYMNESTSSQMQWNKEELVNDGKMCHPADRRHGSTWIGSMNGLQRMLVILGWVLLLMASTPLACKMLHTPHGLLS